MATHRIPPQAIDAEPKPPETLSPTEARAAFERAAQHYLGVSGDEFLRTWDAGEYGPDPDAHPGVMDVAMLLPWAR
ncbi:MAG: hypothetical protein AB7I38_15190 [Dehalococcoidia bacterium]